MRQDHLIKQAYVRGLAARGLLRQYVIKAAEKDTGKAALKNARETANKAIDKGRDIATDAIGQATNKDSWKDYALYGGVGALGGGALGALIQAARQKEIFPGIAIGSGLGGTLGLGTRAALNVLNTTGVLSDERLENAANAVRSGMGVAKDYTNQGMDQADSWWNNNKDMVKNIAMSGGIGAAGGSIIGALIQAAREKNILLGAGIGGGLGGIAGVGVGAAPYITDFVKKKQEEAKAKEEKDKQEIENLKTIGGMAARGAGRGVNWIQKQLERMGNDLQKKYVNRNTNNENIRSGNGIDAGYKPDLIIENAKKNLTSPHKVINELISEGISRPTAEKIVENSYWTYYQEHTSPEQYEQYNK